MYNINMELSILGYNSFKEFEKDYPSYEDYKNLPNNLYIKEKYFKGKKVSCKSFNGERVDLYKEIVEVFNEFPKDFKFHYETPLDHISSLSQTFWKDNNIFYCFCLSCYDKNIEDFKELDFFKIIVNPYNIEIEKIFDSREDDTYYNAEYCLLTLDNVLYNTPNQKHPSF